MNEGTTRKSYGPYTSALERNVVFFLVAMGVVAVTYGVLYVIDFLPERPGVTVEEDLPIEDDTEMLPGALIDAGIGSAPVVTEPLPISIRFDALDREVAVLNPSATDVATLDAALLKGVVRHPDSADFKDEGTIFLFGHSSYLPTVKNKNYQAFNGIQNLKWGDVVRLSSNEIEYIYRVDSVRKASATDASVDVERGEPKLVLVTCNTFGAKDDRYIVEASLLDQKSRESTQI